MNLDNRIFVNVVTTIWDYFLDNIGKLSTGDDPCHLHFDVKQEDDFCIIYVINFGSSGGHFEDVLASFFNELSPRIDIHSYFETITVLDKAASGEEWAYDLRYPENQAYQICMRRLDAKEAHLFTHMKKYQCFKLKSTLPSKDINSVAESISKNLKYLNDLHSSCLNVKKYAFRPEGKKMCDACVEPSEATVTSRMMSSAIMKIIGQSRNDEFRKQCLTLLDVSDTRETGEAIMRKLTSLVQADSRQERKKENKVSTASRNDQARTSVIVNQENNKVNDEYNRVNTETKRENRECSRVNTETKRANRENKRVIERSSNTNSDQRRTNGKENNRADTVDLPIIVSSRGRIVKKPKFYDEMHSA